MENFAMLIDNLLEWKTNVHEEGRQEGRQEGEQVGLRLGELAVLRRQLERKYGPLPTDVVDRLERADVDQLLQWSDHILTAKTLDKVFED